MDYIRYLGHSGFELAIKDTFILIDPFFGAGLKERCLIPLLRPDHIKKVDLILLTHEHLTHADPNATAEFVQKFGSSVVAPSQTLQGIDIPERNKVDVRIGDKFTLKGIEISVVKAQHPQSVYPVGYIIKDYISFYHAGDTYQFYEMSDIVVDYAAIPIGGSYTMDVIDAANATKLLRAKYIIPVHYNTYQKIVQEVSDFKRRVSRGKVIVLKPDESIEIKK